MRLCSIVVLALLLAGISASAVAAAPQDPADQAPLQRSLVLDELLLKDGSRLYGTVERGTDDEVVFRTHAGVQVTVRRADIVHLRKVKGVIERGEFWRADPNRTRLLFGPTGQSLRKGEVSLGFYQILMPFVQVGVTDRFSVGGGTPLFFGPDDWERPFWLTPKLQVFRSDRVQVAIGTMHVLDTGGDDHGGIAYAVGTMQGRDGSLSVGIGRTYTGFDGGGSVLMVGAEGQVARGVKLLTENYLWTGGEGVLTGGFRFFGDRRSVDVGLAFPVGMGGFYALPVVNFVYVF